MPTDPFERFADPRTPAEKWRQRARWIIYAPLLLPFVVILLPFALLLSPVLLYHGAASYIRGRRWKSELRSQERFGLSAVRHGDLADGILIVDSSTIGWNVTELWWTPDDIAAISPHPLESGPPKDPTQQQHEPFHSPFDAWVYDNYLDAAAGSAVLIKGRRGLKHARRLHAEHPSSPVIFSWSAGVLWSRHVENRQAQEATSPEPPQPTPPAARSSSSL